jgi:hypothetical protein
MAVLHVTWLRIRRAMQFGTGDTAVADGENSSPFLLEAWQSYSTWFLLPQDASRLPLSSSEDLLAVHVYVFAACDLPHARFGEIRASLLKLYWLLGTYDHNGTLKNHRSMRKGEQMAGWQGSAT